MALAYRFVCDMSDKQDRPYVCSAPGCSQGFHSEDHLVIHRHKHEMTLKFSSIKADSTFTDQTPTPTRFLRNCEEVGLFKEIEEEFLQAQEEEKNKTLSHNGSSRPHHQPPSQHQQHHQLKPPQLQLQHPAAHQPQQHAHPQPSLHHHPHLHPCLPHAQGQAHGPAMMGPSCSLAAPQASQSGSVITTQASSTYSGPGSAGPLPSSLLHMRNRPRQPLPASMPGTLPDPAMQGASAQHMAMDRHGLMGIPGPTHNNPSCASPQRSKQTMGHHHHHQPQQHPGMAAGGSPMDNIVGHMMGMMSQRQQAPPLQHHPSAPHQLQAPPLTYQQRYHAPPPVQLMGNAHAAAAAHQLHQSPGNVPHPQVHQSPPSHLHQGSPLSIHSQASPMNQQPSHSHHHAVQPCSSGSSSSSSSGCGGGGGGGGGRRRRTADQDPDERRQKFLERNRAAATRCRQKRKVWVSALEKKAEELTHTNLQLQNEVTSLRSEVGQLKQILLTHKDCPVTARQRETPGFPTAGMSPGGSPAPVCPGSSRLQAVQHNSISTSSPAGGDRGHELHPGH